jgi:hypothetical protein
LVINKYGRLVAKPALDEFGQAHTRFEYPRHRPRETADGEEKQAAKKDDDIINTDRALAGRVYYMIKSLTNEERLRLKYEVIYDRLRGVSYPDAVSREMDRIEEMSLRYHQEAERRRQSKPDLYGPGIDFYEEEFLLGEQEYERGF